MPSPNSPTGDTELSPGSSGVVLEPSYGVALGVIGLALAALGLLPPGAAHSG